MFLPAMLNGRTSPKSMITFGLTTYRATRRSFSRLVT